MKIAWAFLTLGIAGFLLWSTIRIISGIGFDMHCSQYLTRAGNANSVELAKPNIESAIRYLESNGLTNGIVSIVLRQPGNDIAFFYSNIKACQDELNKVSENTTQLERSNILMKLRETLLENSKKGERVSCPDGISIYPHNVALLFLCSVSLIIGAIGGIRMAYEADHF